MKSFVTHASRLKVYVGAFVLALLTGLIYQDEARVDPNVLGVIAQVIPVLVLAFFVESRALAATMSRSKTETRKLALHERRHLKKLFELTTELAEAGEDVEVLDYEESVARSRREEQEDIDEHDGFIEDVSVITNRLGFVAGVGELAALVAYGYSLTNLGIFVFLCATVIYLGILLLMLTAMAMDLQKMTEPLLLDPSD